MRHIGALVGQRPLVRLLVVRAGRRTVRLVHRVANVARHRLAGTHPPAIADLLAKSLDARQCGVVGDRHGLTDRIDLDGLHAVDAAQHAVQDGLLAGPLEPGGLQDDSLNGSCG